MEKVLETLRYKVSICKLQEEKYNIEIAGEKDESRLVLLNGLKKYTQGKKLGLETAIECIEKC